MGIEVAIISGLLSVGSAVAGHNQQKRAMRVQREAQNEQRALQQAQAMQERRQQIREERIRRAQLLQASENTGVAGSSGALGAASALSNQMATNLAFNRNMIAGGNTISQLNQTAMTAQGKAMRWDQIYGLSAGIFSASGGFNGVSSAFQQPSDVRVVPAPVEERSFT